MIKVTSTINIPIINKVLLLEKAINIKPARNSRESIPMLNANAVPAFISASRRLSR